MIRPGPGSRPAGPTCSDRRWPELPSTAGPSGPQPRRCPSSAPAKDSIRGRAPRSPADLPRPRSEQEALRRSPRVQRVVAPTRRGRRACERLFSSYGFENGLQVPLRPNAGEPKTARLSSPRPLLSVARRPSGTAASSFGDTAHTRGKAAPNEAIPSSPGDPNRNPRKYSPRAISPPGSARPECVGIGATHRGVEP